MRILFHNFVPVDLQHVDRDIKRIPDDERVRRNKFDHFKVAVSLYDIHAQHTRCPAQLLLENLYC